MMMMMTMLFLYTNYVQCHRLFFLHAEEYNTYRDKDGGRGANEPRTQNADEKNLAKWFRITLLCLVLQALPACRQVLL